MTDKQENYNKRFLNLKKKYKRLDRQMMLGRKACLNCGKIADVHFPLVLNVTATFPAAPALLEYNSQLKCWLCNNCYLAMRPTGIGAL